MTVIDSIVHLGKSAMTNPKDISKMEAKNTNSLDEESVSDDSECDSKMDQSTNEASDAKIGLANVMESILNKKIKSKVILAKSKTDKEITVERLKRKKTADKADSYADNGTVVFTKKKRKAEDKETDSEDDESLKDPEIQKEKNIKKRIWEEMGRMKPDVLDKEKERNLQRIATKGVVQLFNAVKTQQKMISDKIDAAGPSEKKQEKAIKSISKGQFIDLLKGTNASVEIKKAANVNKKKTREISSKETNTKEKPSWNILQDDFMMGAKMKDWDKDSDSDDDAEMHIDQNISSDEDT